MYIMYVDESGDTGLVNSPTRYFTLSGLTVHESRWRDLLNHLVAFRQTMRAVHGLPIRTEIHASHYIRRAPVLGMPKYVRLAILRQLLDELAKASYISMTHVVVDKQGKAANYNVFDAGWQALFQRFENTIGYGNFPGGHKADKGMVIVDNTDGKSLTRLSRKMGVHNPVPGMQGLATRNLPLLRVIEDPYRKDSSTSFFIQAVDVSAYFLHQKYDPCAYVKTKSAQNYFSRLQPVLNTKASFSNGFGIVLL